MAFALFKKKPIQDESTVQLTQEKKPSPKPKEAAFSKGAKSNFEKAKNLHKEKKYTEAIEHYRPALAESPNNIKLLVSLGTCLAKNFELDEAASLLLKAEKLAPTDTSFLTNISGVFVQQLRFNEALPYMLRAIEAQPEEHNLYLRLADIYTGLKRHKDAVTAIDKYLKVQGRDDGTTRIRTIQSQRAGNFTELESQVRFFAINYFHSNKPNFSAVQNRVIEEALDTGIALTHIDELFDDKESQIIQAAQKQVTDFRSSNIAIDLIEKIQACENFEDDPDFNKTFKPSVVNYIACNGEIRANDPMVQMFLHNKILDITNAYNGMLSKIRNVNLWINPAIKGKNLGVRKGSQLWHRDQEDEKILKCFIYLTDVDAESGALDYVKYSKCIPDRRNSELHPYPFSTGYPGKYIFDKHIDEKDIITASCKKGTIAFVDTNGFHRGGYVTKDERIVLMATYLRPTSPYVLTNSRLKLKDVDAKNFAAEALYSLS
jgi:tetratricopeptide (TPR) repeat protein